MFLGACSELPLPGAALADELLAPLPPPFAFVLALFRKRGSLAAFTIFPWFASRW